MPEPRTEAGRLWHEEWHDGESFYGAPKECGTMGCGFLGRILAIEAEAGALSVERLARAIAATKAIEPDDTVETTGGPVSALDYPEEWFETPRELARQIAAEYDRVTPPMRPEVVAQIEKAVLDEPTLTRILNRLAPIIGGDLLTLGVRHRIGLSSAIIAELAAIRSAAPVEPSE